MKEEEKDEEILPFSISGSSPQRILLSIKSIFTRAQDNPKQRSCAYHFVIMRDRNKQLPK